MRRELQRHDTIGQRQIGDAMLDQGGLLGANDRPARLPSACGPQRTAYLDLQSLGLLEVLGHMAQ
jgi:hypothetical protein